MDGYITSDELAARLGIKRDSVYQMRSRGDIPEPDMRVGRTPVWRPETIASWEAARPGQGWRGKTKG